MASKPIYSAHEEQELMTRLWSPEIADDLEAYVMFSFPWGEKGTPLEHRRGPRKWQRRILQRITECIRKNKDKTRAVQMGFLQEALYEAIQEAVASGRGIGKSALVAWLILWMLSTRIGSTVIVSANSEPQLKNVTWGELGKWHTMAINSHWFVPAATTLNPAPWLTSLVETQLKKGTVYWRAEGKLWSEEKPDAYAGVHNQDGVMVIFDEGSGIADSIWSVAKGFFTENVPDRYWFAFSNPRRNQGYFYDCFHSKREFWTTEQIDARTVEDTDKKIYEEIIAEYGEDSTEARVEVYGEFPKDGDEQFISPYIVQEAAKRPLWNDMGSPITMGVDPAGEGKDGSRITVVRGRDVLYSKKYLKLDFQTLIGVISDAIEEWQPVMTYIDEGGLGWGVVGHLKAQRYKIRGVNSSWGARTPTVWGNKRVEMWGDMKQWLKTASLWSIREDKQALKDLSAPRRKKEIKSDATLLESKKEMKGRKIPSPDFGDSLALNFAFQISNARSERAEKTKRVIMSSGRGLSGVANSWMSA